MQGPGQSLRQAREAQGKTIEEMAEATGIRLTFLTALEQEALDSLPGRGFGKLYIRACAEVLGFDPRPVIEAYDRAIRETDAAALTSDPAGAPRPVNAMLARWRPERVPVRPEEATFEGLEAEEEPEPELIEEPEVQAAALPVEAVSPSRPMLSLWWPGAALLLLVLLPLMAYFFFSRSAPDSPPVAARSIAPQAVEAPYNTPHDPPRALPPGREQATPSSLEVAESGIGLRLVGTRLEGEGDRFVAGQRVTFATRVLGGAAGEHIRHVWLRDGKVEQSISLPLGGASWRTYSIKTLGRPGAWAVEARDEQGRVLARADLTVAP
jgi:transcriptional regulator with XRE-family HTH domain